MSLVCQVWCQLLGKLRENSLRPSKEKNCTVYVKKPATLLNTQLLLFKYFSKIFARSKQLVLLFIKIGKINTILLKINLYITKFLFQKQSAVRRCSSKQVFLEISQYSQENSCVGGGDQPVTLLKRDCNTGVFLRILRNF